LRVQISFSSKNDCDFRSRTRINHNKSTLKHDKHRKEQTSLNDLSSGAVEAK
jgi:hypothetical protein